MRLTTPIAARPVIAGAFLAVAAGCAPAPALGPAAIPELAGRTAGAPQRCVPIEQTESLRIADGGTILYGSGRTLWVNRLATQCPGIDRMDILIVEPVGSQY